MSEHRITAKLPCGKDGSETFRADITYTFTPGDPGCRTLSNGDPGWPPSGAELELLKVTPLSNGVTRGVELLAIADTWLQDEGYDAAVQHAEFERGESWKDWEGEQ